MARKEVNFDPGTKLVTMPHAEIYDYLNYLAKQIEISQSEVSRCSALSRSNPESKEHEQALSTAMRIQSFYASAARIYPALFIEAFVNFVATLNDIQFRTDFERFSAHKKLALYVYLLTHRSIDTKYVEFVKKVFALRDLEVHPKPKIEKVGATVNEAVKTYQGSLYRKCTLITIICSINKLVGEVDSLVSTTKHKLPAPKLVSWEYPNCHSEENAHFQI
jgi:hypothetical protein